MPNALDDFVAKEWWIGRVCVCWKLVTLLLFCAEEMRLFLSWAQGWWDMVIVSRKRKIVLKKEQTHIRHLMWIKWLPRRAECLAVLSALDKTEKSVVSIKPITMIWELQVHCEGKFSVQSCKKGTFLRNWGVHRNVYL